MSEVCCLIDRVTESALLSLIDVVQALTDVDDTVLVFLALSIEFAQMVVG